MVGRQKTSNFFCFLVKGTRVIVLRLIIMPIAYLTTRGLEAKIVSERLELKIPSRTEGAFPKQKHIPLADIEHIVLDYSVNLSLQDLSKLLSRKIPVHFVARDESGIVQVRSFHNQFSWSRFLKNQNT